MKIFWVWLVALMTFLEARPTNPVGSPRVTLLTTGDVMVGRTINARSVANNNYDWPFEKTRNLLTQADVTFINLESPLIPGCPVATSGFKFCGSDRFALALARAGVDVASLANNHTGNYGQTGLKQTGESLGKVGVLATVSGGAVFKTVSGTEIAFLGYDDTISPLAVEQMEEAIRLAKAKSDIVVVAMHWGVEYASQPTARQKMLGEKAIDAGASLVVGHHPHWVQPIVKYKEGYIYYSLGNFVFDQFWSEETRKGIVVVSTFQNGKIVGVEEKRIYIEKPGIPSIS